MKFRIPLKDLLLAVVLIAIGVLGLYCVFRTELANEWAVAREALFIISLPLVGAGIGALVRQPLMGVVVWLVMLFIGSLILPHLPIVR